MLCVVPYVGITIEDLMGYRAYWEETLLRKGDLMILDGTIGRSDMLHCVLCNDAPCTGACTRGVDPARILRGVWFTNDKAMAVSLPEENPCEGCNAPCERACVRFGKVAIQRMITLLTQEVRPKVEVSAPVDESLLACDLCGVPLENPFLLGSSVVASTYDMCARAFEAGWAGAAFKTVCTLDIHEASPRFSAIRGEFGTIAGFKNIEQLSDHTLEENLSTFRHLKQAYPGKVVIASIMGQNEEEWERLAGLCQEAGADVVELNLSCPNMAEGGLGSDVGQVPELVEQAVAAARRGTSVPLIAKLTPNVAHMAPASDAAKRAGADGIAAINTIKSIVDVNPHTYVSSPSVRGIGAVGGYSGQAVRPIALRFIAELAADPQLAGMHLSGIGGIETWRDALEFLMLGAGSVQVCTAVMQYGYRIIDDLKAGLALYLAEKGFASVRDVIGLGVSSVSDTTAELDRDSVVYPRFKRERCLGCGRCALSCADGGHQAIRMDEHRRPVLNPAKCVGCHLCVLVCPEAAVVSSAKRVIPKS